MPKLIYDRFTSLPVTPQRRWQLRREHAGACRICGEPALIGRPLCFLHDAAQRRYNERNSPRVENSYDLI